METLSHNFPVRQGCKIASFIGSGINGNLFAYVADNCFNKRFEIASFIGGGINGNWFVGIFKKYC